MNRARVIGSCEPRFAFEWRVIVVHRLRHGEISWPVLQICAADLEICAADAPPGHYLKTWHLVSSEARGLAEDVAPSLPPSLPQGTPSGLTAPSNLVPALKRELTSGVIVYSLNAASSGSKPTPCQGSLKDRNTARRLCYDS